MVDNTLKTNWYPKINELTNSIDSFASKASQCDIKDINVNFVEIHDLLRELNTAKNYMMMNKMEEEAFGEQYKEYIFWKKVFEERCECKPITII